MILAAGYGRRLRPLTDHTPKPLLLVQGKPLIQYHLERLAAAGITDIVINHSWLGEQLENTLGDGSAFGVRIRWSREQSPLETGGGVKRALSLLTGEPEQGPDEAFLLISGDIWTDYPFELLKDIASRDLFAHLVLAPNPEHNSDGDFHLDEQDKVGVKQAPERSLTYTGIALIRPALFTGFATAGDVFPLREVLLPAIVAGKVSGEVFSGTWSDVGTLDRLNALNQ
jgi:MurNAc alpha-1-phosphate uridylyltransferase